MFECPQGDPLATEHQLLHDWTRVAVETQFNIYDAKKANLKGSEAGETIYKATGEDARRIIAAASEQLIYNLEREEEYLKKHARGRTKSFRPSDPEFQAIRVCRDPVLFVLHCLLQPDKTLLQLPELRRLMTWHDRSMYIPSKNPELKICKAVKAFCASHELDDELRTEVQAFAKRRQSVHDKKIKQIANEILKQIASGGPSLDDVDYEIEPEPAPAMAGRIGVLEELKIPLGMMEVDRDYGAIDPDDVSGKFDSLYDLRYEWIRALLKQMATRSVQWRRETLFDLILFESARQSWYRGYYQADNQKLCDLVEMVEAEAPLSEGERFVLWLFRASTICDAPEGQMNDDQLRLTRLVHDRGYFFLTPFETWTERLNYKLGSMPSDVRATWEELLQHCMSATSARPSRKWLTAAKKMIDGIGTNDVGQFLAWLLPLVQKGENQKVIGQWLMNETIGINPSCERDCDCLRGLLWLVQCLNNPEELVHEIRDVAISCYKKVPGVGPRAPKVGNAAVYALSTIGTIEAVGQLAVLKLRVKSRATQKEIEKAFNKSAEALGLSRDEIEELGVPTYGLQEVGRLEEQIGDYTARIEVDGSDAALSFSDAKGKQLKSVPAKVRSDHKDELKELRQQLKDIKGMLPAQRDRIDSMFLVQNNWTINLWRERYLKHPLVGTIVRRLIWNVDGTPALFLDGEPRDVAGKKIKHGKTAEITLWHPIHFSVEEIVAWRDRLEELAVTQPFKQAFREVYPVTAAEQNTRTYSNRFAAHVVRQHQFNALCQARGWKNKLRLLVDDVYPPAEKELPQWGLRAEFWIEGIGEEWGVDTNDAGTYLRLVTDQVRFYRLDAAENNAHAGGGGYQMNAAGPGEGNVNDPIPLEEIPDLVFSEIMRDVDLFVGVSSIGNDPTWQDGGPEGRYRDYWQSYAFGDLSQSARTRKEVLERLIPRLKIAPQCRLKDKFLFVEGTRHVYKIHLGSGNILMSPNDRYLCIVPDARARVSEDSLYLPFEGDGMLSVILSKAFLLAADDKIKDKTILAQL